MIGRAAPGRLAIVLAAAVAAVPGRAAATPPVIGVAATAPVVEVLDPSGAIDRAAAQDALGKIARELARCGSEAGWAGDALAWIVVDWHGKVGKLELAVDKPAVETCFAAELHKLVIARARGPATVFARLRLAPALVSTKHAVPEEPPVKRGEVRATRIAPGERFADADRVRDALRRQLQDATVCYEQALEARPRLTGSAAIELSVAPSGAVDGASVGSAPGTMADCLKRAMLRVRLPAPSAADKVRIDLQLGPTSEPAK